MPVSPKGVDKKPSKHQKNASDPVPALKSIDPSEYIRQPLPNSTVGNDEKTIKIASVDVAAYVKINESMFPEWTLVGETWGNANSATVGKNSTANNQLSSDVSNSLISQYPQNLHIANFKSIRELCGIASEPELPKGSKKKPVSHSHQLNDAKQDEYGRRLPQIFAEVDNIDFKSSKWSQAFATDENLVRIDSAMCSVFEFIAQFAPTLYKQNDLSTKASVSNTKSIQTINSNLFENYLWRLIYPKIDSGKPCYNASGKYAVKIFFAGKWRKLLLDEWLPVREDGKLAVASSSDSHELWPSLLSKAVYTVFYQSGYVYLV